MTSARTIPIATLRFTPEDVESALVTPCGVPYQDEMTLQRRRRFIMFAAPGITNEMLLQGQAELRSLDPAVSEVLVSRRIHKGVFELLVDWLQLRDIHTEFEGPNVDCILSPFLHFEVGAHREDVWRWFAEENPSFPLGQMFDGAYRHPHREMNLKDVTENIVTMCSDLDLPLPSTLKSAHELLVKVGADRPAWQRDLAIWREVLQAAMFGGYDSPRMRVLPPVDDTPLVMPEITGFGDSAAPSSQPSLALNW